MSLDTGIAYLHDTWNFIRGGCTCEIRCLKMAGEKKLDGCWSSVSSRQQVEDAHKTKIVFAGDLTDFFANTTVHNRLRPRAWDLNQGHPQYHLLCQYESSPEYSQAGVSAGRLAHRLFECDARCFRHGEQYTVANGRSQGRSSENESCFIRTSVGPHQESQSERI